MLVPQIIFVRVIQEGKLLNRHARPVARALIDLGTRQSTAHESSLRVKNLEGLVAV
jgi:hypothetical protein